MTKIVYPATVEFDEGEPMTFRWASLDARTAGMKHLRKKRGVTGVRLMPPEAQDPNKSGKNGNALQKLEIKG